MANPPPTRPTLPCKECGYANEPERVYCHNCGAKLDRSVLPKDEEIRRESPDRARKRIMRMANPPSNVIKREVAALFKTLFYAFFTACIIQSVRSPDGLPGEKTEMGTRLVSSDLSDLTQSPTPKPLTFTQSDINGYLKLKVKGKDSIPGVEFKRLMMTLDEGTARVILAKSVWGYPMYLGTIYHVEGAQNAISATNLGGFVGRMPIPAAVMDKAGPLLFGDVLQALKREWEQIRGMRSVAVHKEKVDLVSRGRQ